MEQFFNYIIEITAGRGIILIFVYIFALAVFLFSHLAEDKKLKRNCLLVTYPVATILGFLIVFTHMAKNAQYTKDVCYEASLSKHAIIDYPYKTNDFKVKFLKSSKDGDYAVSKYDLEVDSVGELKLFKAHRGVIVSMPDYDFKKINCNDPYFTFKKTVKI